MTKKIFIAIAFTFLTTGASAHSALKTISPANNAIVAQAPKTIELTFKNSIYLTKITLKYDDVDLLYSPIDTALLYLSINRYIIDM